MSVRKHYMSVRKHYLLSAKHDIVLIDYRDVFFHYSSKKDDAGLFEGGVFILIKIQSILLCLACASVQQQSRYILTMACSQSIASPP